MNPEAQHWLASKGVRRNKPRVARKQFASQNVGRVQPDPEQPQPHSRRSRTSRPAAHQLLLDTNQHAASTLVLRMYFSFEPW